MLNNFIQEVTSPINCNQCNQIQLKSLSPIPNTSKSFILERKKLKVIDNILQKPYKLDTKALCKVIELGINYNNSSNTNIRSISPNDNSLVTKIYAMSPNNSQRPYSPLNKYQTPTSKSKYQKHIQNLKPVGSEQTQIFMSSEQVKLQYSQNSIKSLKKIDEINYKPQKYYQKSSAIRVRTFQAPQNISKLLKEPDNQICRYLPFLEQSFLESQKLEQEEDKKLVYMISDKSILSKYVKQALDNRSQFWVDANQANKKRTPVFKWSDKINNIIFMNMLSFMKENNEQFVKAVKIKNRQLVHSQSNKDNFLIYNHFQFEEELMNKYIFWQNIVSHHQQIKLKYMFEMQALLLVNNRKIKKQVTNQEGGSGESKISKKRTKEGKLSRKGTKGSEKEKKRDKNSQNQNLKDQDADNQLLLNRKDFELKEIVEIIPPTIILDMFNQDFIENLKQFFGLFSKIKSQGDTFANRGGSFETIYSEIIEFFNEIKQNMTKNSEQVKVSDRDFKYKQMNVQMPNFFTSFPSSFISRKKNIWIVKQIDVQRMGKKLKSCSTVIKSHEKLVKILKECINVYRREHQQIQKTVYPKFPWTYRFVIQKYLEDPLLVNNKKCTAKRWVLLSQLSKDLKCYLYTKGIVQLQFDRHLVDKNENKSAVVQQDNVQKSQTGSIAPKVATITNIEIKQPVQTSSQNKIISSNQILSEFQLQQEDQEQAIEYISWEEFEAYQTSLLKQQGLIYVVEKQKPEKEQPNLSVQEEQIDRQLNESIALEQEDSIEFTNDFQIMKEEMEKIVKLSMQSIKYRINEKKKEGSLMILEFDYLIDQQYNPYLAGINYVQAFENYPQEFLNSTLPDLLDQTFAITLDNYLKERYQIISQNVQLRDIDNWKEINYLE
ncbi:tubulin-tyrosine ligase family protein (macronuclear) [Tetrahymena thermophila SB210]|uniref:Tubulin-tyrosine ligase family protein n=1 Tax=Tetrahymena thermophila (strain SB210) TaxID=312017 RepID=I7MH08_TETTS|nr:tubulin-tyrosine ligase family protein [Tetrahymena thermophila SB210]EAR85657.2 tubulin-tyrosine ligase family protein [Tetrahymena thermophila SB210]|eukprot:XP_001033320.2 tubulin-tyrosine ligase family protein [Tetrahymena thermophila SB210]